jgi:death on curing protein
VEAEPKWLTYDHIIAIHSRQLRRFGGAAGLRDDALLRSAIERPLDKWHCEQAELPGLAAAYAFGLAKNYAFVDGNKRIAFMSMMTFLRKNGARLAPDQAHATKMMISLAAGEVSEESLARWIRDNWPTA